MNLTPEKLAAGVRQGIINPQQAEALWQYWHADSQDAPRFDIIHVAYYGGALLIIFAMAWFLTDAWERVGGLGISAISGAYSLFFVAAGHVLWFRKQMKVPGGLLYTVAVCMAPLVIYGIEKHLGLWPQGDPGAYKDYHIWVKGSWLYMELGTICAGALVLYFVRFPFLTAPIAFSLWYMSMDFTPLLFGKEDFTGEERCWVSLWFGLVMIAISFLIDRWTKNDFSFWGYLFGTMAFWGGLSMMDSKDELSRFIYCMINLVMILTSVLLNRQVFIIFGGFGVFTYLSHLANVVFKDSLLFPVAVSVLGVGVLALGIVYQRNQQKIEESVVKYLPHFFRRLRE